MWEPDRQDRWHSVHCRIPTSLTPGRLVGQLAVALAVLTIMAAVAGPASAKPISNTAANTSPPDGVTAVAPAASPGNWTFSYTGGPQVFTVPAGVTFLTATVTGGRGGYPNDGAGPDRAARRLFP